MIRAKFTVNSVTSWEGGNEEVRASKLKAGKSYYLDFTEAE